MVSHGATRGQAGLADAAELVSIRAPWFPTGRPHPESHQLPHRVSIRAPWFPTGRPAPVSVYECSASVSIRAPWFPTGRLRRPRNERSLLVVSIRAPWFPTGRRRAAPRFHQADHVSI